MKRLTTLFVIGFSYLMGTAAWAQMPDKSEYRDRFNDCNSQEAKLHAELADLINNRDVIMQEYRNGDFCSDCKRTKSEVEQQESVSFSQHIASSKGRYVVRATEAQIEAKRQKLNAVINSKKTTVDAKHQECDRILTSYDDAQKAAQARAQQETDRDAKKNADDQARHQADAQQKEADEKKRLLAAQQQQEEDARQARLAERLRREEAERVRQAQLAANLLRYQDQLSSNDAATKAKLDEHHRNSGLNDLPAYNGGNARNTVAGTNNGELSRQAFGSDGHRNYLDEDSGTGQTSVREKFGALYEEGKQWLRSGFVKEGNNLLFGEEETNNDNNGGSSWSISNLKNKSGELVRQHIVEKIVAVDKKNGGVLYKYYEEYKKGKQETSLHEDRRLVDFHEDATNAVFNDVRKNFNNLEEYGTHDSEIDDFYQDADKKMGGVKQKWDKEGRRAPLDELVPKP